MAENFFGLEDGIETEDINDVLGTFSADDAAPITQTKKPEATAKPTVQPKIDGKTPATPPIKPIPVKEEEEEEKQDEPFNPEGFFGKTKEEAEEGDDAPEAEEGENEQEDDKNLPVNMFAEISKELYDLGTFKKEFDEEGNDVSVIAETPEQFKQLFSEQSNNKARTWLEQFLSNFGEDRRELFDAIFYKGVDPKEYLPVYNNIEALETLSLDNEINQKKVIREFYKRSGLPEAKVEKIIQRLVDTAELETEALDFHPQLVEQDKQRLVQMEEENVRKLENERRADADYRNSITRILTEKLKTKEYDGIPLTEASAQKTLDFLYTKKYKLPDGKLLTEFDVYISSLNKPENHALKVKLGLLALKNLDLTKVQQKAISKENNELFSAVTKKHEQQKNKNKIPNTNVNSTSDWGNVLK